MTWWTRLKYVLELPFSARQRTLMRERGSYNRDDFIKYFGTDADIAGAVWDQLCRAAVIENFRPAPDDSLLRTFGLADEDLDDIALTLLNEFRCRIPSSLETDAMKPVRTVSDLVQYVAGLRTLRD